MQTLGNNPKVSIQHSEHGRSLKSRIFDLIQDIYSCCCVWYGSLFSVGWCQCAPQNILTHVPQHIIFAAILFFLVVWVWKSSVPLLQRICFGTSYVRGFYEVIKIHLTYDFLTVGERTGRGRAAITQPLTQRNRRGLWCSARSPFITLLPWCFQFGWWSSFRKWVWFTESHIVLIVSFFTCCFIYSIYCW